MNWPWMTILPGDLLTVVGLCLDIIGIILLFWVAPEKTPDPQSTVSFAIDKGIRECWRKQQILRKWLARASLSLIVVGFSLQAVAVIWF